MTILILNVVLILAVLALGFLVLGALRALGVANWWIDQLQATTPGRIGRGALSLAVIASGLLAVPYRAEAQFGPVCCWYWEVTNNYSPGAYTKCGKNGYYSCPKPRKGYVLYGAQ